MFKALNHLDRRWVFLAMGLAVGIPILLGLNATEIPSERTLKLFEYIDSMPEGSRVLMAMDFDPNTAGELEPMAMAFARHCALKRHRMYFLTLWPSGLPMVDRAINAASQPEFVGGKPLIYGEDYLNLGYIPGEYVAPGQLATSIRKNRAQDIFGTSLDRLPMMQGIVGVRDLRLIINVSGGWPGAKEWVQNAATPHNIPMIAGCTGVQSTQLFPYYPDQIVGLLAAIRGAAEYEAALADKYPQFKAPGKRPAMLRLGAQRWAHRLMIGLILVGNVLYVANRRTRTSNG